MFYYTYPKDKADTGRLGDEAQKAGLPVVARAGTAQVLFTCDRVLTAPEQTTLAQVVKDHDGRPRRLREAAPVVQDVKAFIDVPANAPPWAIRLARVACLALAYALRQDPNFARRLGDALDGEEPDPAA